MIYPSITTTKLYSSSFVIVITLIICDFVNSNKFSSSRHASNSFESTASTNNQMSSSLEHHNVSKPSRHIIITTLEVAPFMMKKLTDNQNNASSTEWYGYCMEFFEELRKHLPYDLTYDIYQVSDNKYGSKSKFINMTGDQKQTGNVVVEKWNGLIGELFDGRADLALAPMAVMAERELVIDFTVPFYDLVGIQILLKKPEVARDWFKFLTVLDNEVWLSITIAYFVTSFVMFLFDRLSPYSHKNISRIEKIKKVRGLEKEKLVEKNITSISSIENGSKLGGDPSDILSRSHNLYVGSLGYPMMQSRKRSSTLIREGFDNFFRSSKKRSIWPANDKNSTSRRRQSTVSFNDYFRGVDLRKGSFHDNYEDDLSDDLEDGKPNFGFRDSLWFCITSLTPQGGGEAPQNLSGRVVAGAWWLFCFIIIASYTANLAAFLTVSRLDIPIESLDDLAKQYRIKYAPIDGTAEQTYFERMAYIEEIFYNIWKEMSLNDTMSEEERSKFAVWDYPISDKYTKIWAQIQQVGMPQDAISGIRRVKDSNLDDGFALLADANMVKHAVMTDCSFKAVGDEFSRKPIALALRKGDDQFRDDLSYAILQLINQRFMEILREKWWTNNPDRVICDNNDESEGISIENIGGVFIIIFAGVLFSFLVWSLERLVYKTKMRMSKDLLQKLQS